MKIHRIIIKNFRSIEKTELVCKDINILVGQNNHGKTNYFEAINWFFNGSGVFDKSVKPKYTEAGKNSDLSVEIEFNSLKEKLRNISNDETKTTLKNNFGNTNYITIKKAMIEDKTHFDHYYKASTTKWKPIDINKDDIVCDDVYGLQLPKLEYIHTNVKLNDVEGIGRYNPIGDMLKGVLSAMIESDKHYMELTESLKKLLGSDKSLFQSKLNDICKEVEVNLRKQFTDDVSVNFDVPVPEITDLIKHLNIKVNDGVNTLIEEKGDGMKRAVMLAIIQTYSAFKIQKKNSR